MTVRHTLLRCAAGAFLLLSANPAVAGDTARPAAEMAQPVAVRPALWKVADEDTTIWLFGTIHILPEDMGWYAGPVAAAFDGSTELVTEIAIDDTADSQTMIQKKSLRTDNKLLRETLGKQELAAYDAGMISIGLPPQAFDRNDAWYAALMLTLIPLKVAGYNLESGVDKQVADKARTRDMKNQPLETADYQISLFDSLPDKTQRRYLGDVLEALPTVKTDIDAMVAAWKTGDANELARLLNEEEDDAQLRKVLLTDRNRAWAKWLHARLEEPGVVFVAVGAGHLAGKGSVQDQLKRMGIEAVRVQ